MEKDAQPLFDERELDDLNGLDVPNEAEAKPGAPAEAPRAGSLSSSASGGTTPSCPPPAPISSSLGPAPASSPDKSPAPAATSAGAASRPPLTPATGPARASHFVPTGGPSVAAAKPNSEERPTPRTPEQQSLQQIQLILEQIQGGVDQLARERRHRTFSVARLIGAVAQVVAVAFVVLAVADAAFGRRGDQQLNLMSAVVFQLGALTAFFLGRDSE